MIARIVLFVLAACAVQVPVAGQESWLEDLLRRKEAPPPEAPPGPRALPDLGEDDYTLALWMRTGRDGSLVAKTKAEGKWLSGGKTLFVRNGRVCFDIGWVGAVEGHSAVSDGRWHHVTLSGAFPQQIYVDGKLEVTGRLRRRADVDGSVLKIGHTSKNFPAARNGFEGELDDVRLYARRLSAREIEKLALAGSVDGAGGAVAWWPLDGSTDDASGGRNPAEGVGAVAFDQGRIGQALRLRGKGHLRIRIRGSQRPDDGLWTALQARFGNERSLSEMAWEREDGIWGADWRTVSWGEVARRYADAVRYPDRGAARARKLAGTVTTAVDLREVRALYLFSRRYAELLAETEDQGLDDLEATTRELHGVGPRGRGLLQRLGRLRAEASGWESRLPEERDLAAWKTRVATLRRAVVLEHNPLIDFQRIVFVKRNTYDANHYYTEYVNSTWKPGGGLFVLSLVDGSEREIVPELRGGVFGRFDVDFDARTIVFAWKKAAQEGYRIYEVGVDGTGLRQLTHPPGNEAELVEKYRVAAHYHHGTDDMHPCYLPDGDIAFISTRCQYGILCDAPDDFTTTVLYRMDADGGNLRKLTNSSVSEAAPVMLPDGRILYTRWEYVDKGAVSVKCLWAMRPDGSASSEVYAADIALPPTFIYGRAIPGAPNRYVVLGTPHYPQNGMGTVIRLNMDLPIRTRQPMTYLTPYVDIRAEGGFHQRAGDGTWRRTDQAPLFKDPFPLSENLFLVACKPAGVDWRDARGFGLYLLDGRGRVHPFYRDPEISSFLPYPLKARKRPPVLPSIRDEKLAARGLAVCVVTDVYRGLEGVPRGSIKFLRVLEQVPRPWAARRRWGGDCVDQQHSTVSLKTHLGLKVQHGVVPVEEDGSARFFVPAEKNVFLQALDADYMAVQTERTYVNYMPGETRSCIGCHETPERAPGHARHATVTALGRPPSLPGPQPGEKSGRRPLHFPTDVQPVLDTHCVSCHGDERQDGGLDLRGTPTTMFSTSYESLLDPRYLPVIGENHPKTGNVHYLGARSLGSHASLLVAMLAPGKVQLRDEKRLTQLAAAHDKVALSPAELLRITNWVDTNGQFYGSYWGRKNLRYRDHPNFRPVPTFESAASMTSPLPEAER